MAILQTLKSLVNERLSAAAEEIFGTIARILAEYEDEAILLRQGIEHQRSLLVVSNVTDILHLPLCKEEVSPEKQKRNSSLVQEELEPPQIKDEQEELLLRPEERLTLIAVKSEDADDYDNRETKLAVITSSEHMETHADAAGCEKSQPTSDDQFLSSHCSESDTDDTEDSDDWEETRGVQSALNTLKSHKTQNMGGQTLSLKNKLTHDLTLSKQIHSMGHQKEKNIFGCIECGKMFKHKGSLKKHTMIHTGEKPFTCAVCGKDFGRKDVLEVHMITHKREKPFTCTICGKGCSHNGHLKIHMRIHTGERPFTCTACGKGFVQTSALKTHMQMHTGERPFTCTVCGKGCREMGNLKKHMRTHTGE